MIGPGSESVPLITLYPVPDARDSVTFHHKWSNTDHETGEYLFLKWCQEIGVKSLDILLDRGVLRLWKWLIPQRLTCWGLDPNRTMFRSRDQEEWLDHKSQFYQWVVDWWVHNFYGPLKGGRNTEMGLSRKQWALEVVPWGLYIGLVSSLLLSWSKESCYAQHHHGVLSCHHSESDEVREP